MDAPSKKNLALASCVRQDEWQAAIFGGRNHPSLPMVAHQLASASKGDFFVERNSFRFFRSVGSV